MEDDVQIQPPSDPTARAGWEDWQWLATAAEALVTNLSRLEEELVVDAHTGRRDQVLLEAVADELDNLCGQCFSAQVRARSDRKYWSTVLIKTCCSSGGRSG